MGVRKAKAHKNWTNDRPQEKQNHKKKKRKRIGGDYYYGAKIFSKHLSNGHKIGGKKNQRTHRNNPLLTKEWLWVFRDQINSLSCLREKRTGRADDDQELLQPSFCACLAQFCDKGRHYKQTTPITSQQWGACECTTVWKWRPVRVHTVRSNKAGYNGQEWTTVFFFTLPPGQQPKQPESNVQTSLPFSNK